MVTKKTSKKTSAKKTTKSLSSNDCIVPDTSVLIAGLLSKEVLQAPVKEIIIPEAALAELEAQANKRKETGYLGLNEVTALQRLAKELKFSIRVAGSRPKSFEIEYARSGEIDSLIRQVAQDENATLYTSDVVQAKVAQAKGLPVILTRKEQKDTSMDIESFFDDQTMSVHIKEGTLVTAKRGRPGAWDFVTVTKTPSTRSELEEFAKQIYDAARMRHDGFLEIERKGSTIAQVGRYRIVVTRQPFSDALEITAVRPVKRLTLEDYKLSEKLQKRIEEQAEGMLIAGSPGHGKSTFAQALAEHYAKKEKIIKTVEAPRDMQLANEITQYAISHGSAEEVHDILLLSRPDYTFFDEMRNTDDFKLFADMRLSGVGMIGVMHATKTIDAIQRFLGRIELGVIPHVVDTVIFIKDGGVASVYSVKMTVKVPTGMTEADLARPIVEVHDFESGKLVFEIYTYGEQTVVMPVSGEQKQQSVHKFAQEGLKRYFERYSKNPQIEVLSNNKVAVSVSEEEAGGLIGKGGETIRKIEQDLGMSVDVRRSEQTVSKAKSKRGATINFSASDTKTSLLLDVGRKNAHRSVDIYVDDEFLLTAHASKKGMVKLSKRNKLSKIIADALEEEAVSIHKSK